MRLYVISLAVALFLPTLPVAVADTTGPNGLSILSPAEGGELDARGFVTLRYRSESTPMPGDDVVGDVFLGGEWVAGFARPVNRSDPNGTLIVVQVDARNLTNGPQALQARAVHAPMGPSVTAARNVTLIGARPAPEPVVSAIVAPQEGTDLEQTGNVSLRFVHGNATHVAGTIELDDTVVARFIRASNASVDHISVRIDATSLAPSYRHLTANVWTDTGESARLGPILVRLVPTNMPPTLGALDARFDGDLLEVRIDGSAIDMDGQVAQVSVHTPLGNATLASPGENWTLRVPAVAAKPGSYQALVRAVDDGGSWDVRTVNFTVVNRAPVIENSWADYATGGHFLVSGRAHDPDRHAMGATLVMPFGSMSANVTNGTWNFTMRADVGPGIYNGTLIVRDEHGANSSLPVRFDVVPKLVTLYDRTVNITTGSSTDIDSFTHGRLTNMTVEIWTSGATLVGVAKAGDCAMTPPANGRCFIGPAEPRTRDVAWSVNGQGGLRILVTGYAV